jgi:hypothetical protein
MRRAAGSPRPSPQEPEVASSERPAGRPFDLVRDAPGPGRASPQQTEPDRAQRSIMKIAATKQPSVADKMAEAKELCLTRLRAVPREKRDHVADAILALAEPEWWERRQKGSDVFLLILESRKAETIRIIQDASK